MLLRVISVKISHISVVQGDDESILIPIEDGDAGGWIEDFSGMSITYLITTDRGGGTNEIEKTEGDSAISTPLASNIDSQALSDTGVPDSAEVIQIDLSETDTESLSASLYYHECEIEDTLGTTQTVMRGQVEVERSST